MASPTLQPAANVVIELVAVDVPSRTERERVVIPGLNWSVREREFWVVGGLPGSGKSDLLAMLAALTRPLAGQCRVLGQTDAEREAGGGVGRRPRTGLVFDHGGQPFNQLTVWENVALPLYYHSAWEETRLEQFVADWLKATELWRWRERLPSALPPAWRQRMALVRALVLQPEILLLDNPLSVLDPSHTRWWMEFLGQLPEGHGLLENRPMTLVATTDDFRPWRHPGCQFAVLQDLRLRLIGDRGAVCHQSDPLLRQLLAVEAVGEGPENLDLEPSA